MCCGSVQLIAVVKLHSFMTKLEETLRDTWVCRFCVALSLERTSYVLGSELYFVNVWEV